MIYALSLPVILEAPFILGLWLKEVPEHTVVFLRIILMTAMVSSLSGTLITSMHASGKVRDYQIAVGGLSLLTLPISYIVLKLGYPAFSALIVILVIELCCHFMRLFMLKKSIGFPVTTYIRRVTLRCLMVVSATVIMPIAVYLKVSNDFLSFLIICAISLISVLSGVYFLGLDKDEKNVILNKLKHKRQ